MPFLQWWEPDSSYLCRLYHILTQTLTDAACCFQDGRVSNTCCGHAMLETLLRTAAGWLERWCGGDNVSLHYPLCRKLSYMQKQMGYSFLVVFLESCIYKFFISSCLFNNVKSSFWSSPSQFVLLFSFLLLLDGVPGVAHRKQTVTWDFYFTQARDIERYSSICHQTYEQHFPIKILGISACCLKTLQNIEL